MTKNNGNPDLVCEKLISFCSGGQPLHTEQFVVPDRGPIWIDDINCIGNETSIFDCKHKPYGVSNCRHDEDVSVDCSLGRYYKNPSWV